MGFQSAYEEKILCDIWSNKTIIFPKFSDLGDFSFHTPFFWRAASHAGNDAEGFVCLAFGLFSASIDFSRFHFSSAPSLLYMMQKEEPKPSLLIFFSDLKAPIISAHVSSVLKFFLCSSDLWSLEFSLVFSERNVQKLRLLYLSWTHWNSAFCWSTMHWALPGGNSLNVLFGILHLAKAKGVPEK